MKVKTIGIDLAKEVFGVHGVDARGKSLVHKRVSRKHLLGLLAKLEPCLVGMEACGSAHHWAREIEKLGHTVKLMSPQFVAPYRKGNKNDPNDAEAICEAVTRPSMRFVPIKSEAQQDLQALHRVREQLLKSRTALVNQVPGLLGEHGIVAPRGIAHLRRLMVEILAEPASRGLSGLFGETLFEIAERLRFLDERIRTYDLRIGRVFAHDERCQRLTKVEGVGPLVSRPVNKCSIADAAFDLMGGFGPAEGFGIFVPVGQEAGDGLLQARDAVEAAAANGLRGDQAEPALDQVEPRGAGRGEVQMEARVRDQPLFDRGMLVGSVVVADQMQLQLGIALGQRLQEDDELGVPMAPVATPMDLAAGHLQRSEQAGGAVAQVIMGHADGQPGPHRQRRLGAVKRLNLRLFVHAQHQRALRRVQIEPDDIGQLGVELRVAAELEGFDPVRLEPILLPDAMDCGRRQPDLLGQAPRAPMGRRLGLAQRRADYRLLLGRGNPPRAAHTRLGAQPIESRAPIAPPPQTNRGLGYPKPRCQTADTLTRRAAQHHPRSGRQRLRDTLRPQPVLQLGSICSAYFHPASLYAHPE
jgi:Transposase